VSLLMKLVGFVNGEATEHDGRYLMEYDPARMWIADDGMLCVHLLSTDDPANAKVYTCFASLHADWSRAVGTRADGKKDSPLTIYTIEAVRQEHAT